MWPICPISDLVVYVSVDTKRCLCRPRGTTNQCKYGLCDCELSRWRWLSLGVIFSLTIKVQAGLFCCYAFASYWIIRDACFFSTVEIICLRLHFLWVDCYLTTRIVCILFRYDIQLQQKYYGTLNGARQRPIWHIFMWSHAVMRFVLRMLLKIIRIGHQWFLEWCYYVPWLSLSTPFHVLHHCTHCWYLWYQTEWYVAYKFKHTSRPLCLPWAVGDDWIIIWWCTCTTNI